jgi:DNA-binding helix-hairpin-helix protein with protein kinase domain
MLYRLLTTGSTIDLSRAPKIGEGGEARVYSVLKLGLAAKIYHRPLDQHRRKLTAMVANPPSDPTATSGHVSIAWPRDLLLDAQGGFAGYVMPLVGGMKPLINYYVPKLRRRERPLFDYFYLVTTALNVSSVVKALHDRGYVIGDVNESNILVAETALATIVDTDSFQAPDVASGIMHRSLVGKVEFTPPELQGKDFKLVDRTREHDQFGLGVVLFQLLMEGTHPFDGI